MGKAGALIGTVAMMAAGGLVGGLFTPGLFSTIGMSVGTMVGGMLFQQSPGGSGASDLKTGVADPTFLPIFAGGDVPDPDHPGQMVEGGALLPGKIICCPEEGGVTKVRVNTTATAQGTSGKLFGPKTGDGDEHFLNIAVAWCEGSEEHPVYLLELRADDEILFLEGATPDQDGYVERTNAYNSGHLYGWQSDNIRHYMGTSRQLPDDVVCTWWPNGAAPAFRGTSYTVVLNLRIDKFGHVPTIYGRFSNGVTKRIDQCAFFLKRANGLDGEQIIPDEAIQLTKISGYSRAWYMSQPGTVRAIAEQIAARSKCALVEHSYRIWDVDLANPKIHDLENWELGAVGEDDTETSRARFGRGLEEQTKLPSRVEVRYVDARKKDENTVNAILPTVQHENVLGVDMPTVDVEEEMQQWGQITLDAAYVARTPGEVNVLPRRIGIFPGDVVRVPNEAGTASTEMLVRERLLASTIKLKGVGWNADAYNDAPKIIPTPSPVQATTWAAPEIFVANSVSFTRAMLDQPGVIVAQTQRPQFKWEEGTELNVDFRENNVWDEEYDDVFRSGRAVMGQLSADWTVPNSSNLALYDKEMQVEMLSGSLATCTEVFARDGANTLLFENGLIVSAAVATQTGLNISGLGFYELDGLFVARWGSTAGVATIPAGSRFIVLYNEKKATTAGWSFRGIRSAKIGLHGRWRAPLLEKPNLVGIREWDYTGANRKPVAPSIVATRPSGGGLRLVGNARARGRDDQSAPLNEIKLSAGYTFTLVVNNKTVTRSENNDTGAFDWTYTASQLATLLGISSTGIAAVNLAGTITSVGPSWMGTGLAAAWSAPGS